MKFRMGSNTELTQKYERFKVQMTYIRPQIYIYKQISLILNLTSLYSVLLAHQLFIITSGVPEHKWRASLKLHYC